MLSAPLEDFLELPSSDDKLAHCFSAVWR
jgi:hypothetical protein